eukprot:gene1910-2243_t
MKGPGTGAHQHRIHEVPGFSGKLKSSHYGGYITVDQKSNRNLYYYLVESEGNPATDPVVLWLNGGPGCSSFDGFIYEHGPFLFSWADAKMNQLVLQENPFAWSKAATVIYLDSPSAVGLSYSDNHADYATNDTATAADSHRFLRQFFTLYPHLQANDFYISGESYAGIYVPMLTKEVVIGNHKGVKPPINIKGYLVGNGCTDVHFDGNALPSFAVGKSLISTGLYNRLQEACGGSFDNVRHGSRCDLLYKKMVAELSHLNLYNVLEECHHKPHPAEAAAAGAGQELVARIDDAASVGQLRKVQQQRLVQLLQQHRTWPVTGAVPHNTKIKNWQQLLGLDPPCTQSSEAETWLNDPEVRQALHAAPIEKTSKWVLCSDRIDYTSDGGSMLPVHTQLTRGWGLKALIYSGDHDMCVPHTGSEAWTPWYNSEVPRQVAGYVVEYDSGLTYATVKGAEANTGKPIGGGVK